MKRLMKAILWIVCYGGAAWFSIKTRLGFDILSKKNWEILFDKSVHATWPAEIADKKLVCKVLFIFIIVGILGLSVVTRGKKKRVPVVKGELLSTGDTRPAIMPSQGRVGNFSAQQNATLTTAPTTNPMSDSIHQITEIAKTFDVSVFPHVKLENTFTQLVISDDTTALLLKILPQTGTWKVEQTEAAEESLWTLGEEEPKKVLKDIMESTATLTRLEPDANAIGVLVLVNSTLQNPQEVRQYLEKYGIKIATLNAQETSDIPSWHKLLEEFYPVKESEEQNETTPDSQDI